MSDRSAPEHPYGDIKKEEMILRDHLAQDRTHLANERTLLAYLRTALAFLIAGASSIHFLNGGITDVAGVVLILAGAATLIFGMIRFGQFRKRIGK